MLLLQLLLIQIATFIALIFGLRLLFYRHLNSALKRLKQLQEEALIKESEVKKELKRAQDQQAAEIEKGRQTAKQLIEEAKAEADGLRSKIEGQAKQESRKIIEFGQQDLEKLKKNLLLDIDNRALNLAIEIINYTFSQKAKVELQHQLMEELITEIESLDKERFTIRPATNKVKIISSVNLTDTQKKRLEDILGEKLSRHVSLEEEIDPALITGLVIQIDELVIDGSLKNKLSKIIPYLGKK